LQCRLAEKDLLRWAQCNPAQPVGSVHYSHFDVVVNPALPIDEYNALRQAFADFPSVFNAAKGSLPALADHPPVDLMNDNSFESNDIRSNLFFAWHARELNAIFSHYFSQMTSATTHASAVARVLELAVEHGGFGRHVHELKAMLSRHFVLLTSVTTRESAPAPVHAFEFANKQGGEIAPEHEFEFANEHEGLSRYPLLRPRVLATFRDLPKLHVLPHPTPNALHNRSKRGDAPLTPSTRTPSRIGAHLPSTHH
jgi:hypothetical protein